MRKRKYNIGKLPKERIYQICSAGGKAWGRIQREKAIADYYANPNCCNHCGQTIKVKEGQKVSEVKKKQFCNKNCSAIFNNKIPGRKRMLPTIKRCTCGEIISSRVKRCRQCYKKEKSFSNSTLLKQKVSSPNWTRYRAPISKHARKVYRKSGLPFECFHCQYKLRVDICHIKDVAEFPDGTLIKEVNDINNLVALCPNHHWEFDHGYLDIEAEILSRRNMKIVQK